MLISKFTSTRCLNNAAHGAILFLSCFRFTIFLENFLKLEKDPNSLVAKSLIAARFLQALMVLCPHYHKCCVCSSNSDEWDKICNIYNKYSLQFWQNWVVDSVVRTSNESEMLRSVDSIKLISILPVS